MFYVAIVFYEKVLSDSQIKFTSINQKLKIWEFRAYEDKSKVT